MSRAAAGSIDLRSEANKIFPRYPSGRERSGLLPLLHLAQARDGYITREAIAEIAEILEISAAEVVGVASFYSMLKLRPKGRHVVSICHNLACSLMGAESLIAALEGRLGIQCGQTTPDGEFTLERAECLAACEMAPMIQIDHDQMLGPLTAEQALAKVEELRSQAAAAGEATAPRPAAVPASAPAGVFAVDKLAQEAPTDAEARWATPGERPKTSPPGEEPLLIDTIPPSDE